MKKEYFANGLSGLRPVLAVVIFCVVVRARAGDAPLPLWLILIWGFVALTDWLDGVVARSERFGRTANGGTIDEICDKAAVNLVILALCCYSRISWYFFAIMLARDIFATIVRMRARKFGITVANEAKMPGKWKTGLQFLLVLVALCPAAWLGGADAMVIFFLSALAMGMSLVSGMQILLLTMNARDPSWLDGTGGKIGVPNWWSLGRMALAAVIPYIIATSPFGEVSYTAAVIVLAVAIATDAVDGHLARELKQFTKAGKALDPLSDKIIFYPVAIALFIATGGTFLVPGVETTAVRLVMWLSIILTVVRDLSFIVWFALEYKKLPGGIASSLWDKARMVTMCVWLSAMVLAICTQGLMIGDALAWIAFISLIVTGMTLSIASGAVAIVRVQQLKATLGKGVSE
ncbi:MAG: CDP-alcohol phosphatidyltransferase family protein [Candidatus Nomurabacteria bacterium]|jgi:phosphatidylglycerophosphate synthase|nr:CDP-alcohol phosphatidyltransferase family protein [Candidatus Nomurabacteria bacterium]